MEPKIVFTSKVAQTLGGGRIWIGGKRLINTGWKRGDTFIVQSTSNSVTIVRHHPSSRFEPLHVTGAKDRPIIDIVGFWVAGVLGEPGTPTYVTIERDKITVVPRGVQ